MLISPAELALLFEQDAELQRDRCFPAAMVCSVIANAHRDREQKEDPFTPADFMPVNAADQARREAEEAREPSKEEIEAWKGRLFPKMK